MIALLRTYLPHHMDDERAWQHVGEPADLDQFFDTRAGALVPTWTQLPLFPGFPTYPVPEIGRSR